MTICSRFFRQDAFTPRAAYCAPALSISASDPLRSSQPENAMPRRLIQNVTLIVRANLRGEY